jgi:hypothetical protein
VDWGEKNSTFNCKVAVLVLQRNEIEIQSMLLPADPRRQQLYGASPGVQKGREGEVAGIVSPTLLFEVEIPSIFTASSIILPTVLVRKNHPAFTSS